MKMKVKTNEKLITMAENVSSNKKRRWNTKQKWIIIFNNVSSNKSQYNISSFIASIKDHNTKNLFRMSEGLWGIS